LCNAITDLEECLSKGEQSFLAGTRTRVCGKGRAIVSKWTFFAMMLGAIYTGLVVTDDLIRAGFGSVILAIIIWFVQKDRAIEG